MIHRIIFTAQPADSLFLLALSGAAYHHTGVVWLLYPIYFAVAMTTLSLMRDVSTWVSCIGNSIQFHASCIRDKDFDVKFKGETRVIRELSARADTFG